MHQGKNGSCGADSQGERNHRSRGESGGLLELPNCFSYICHALSLVVFLLQQPMARTQGSVLTTDESLRRYAKSLAIRPGYNTPHDRSGYMLAQTYDEKGRKRIA